MTGKGPITPSVVRCFITHKDYAVEMVDSIIKEPDLDPCAEQSSKDLGVSGLYDLSRVCLCHLWYYAFFFFLDGCLASGVGAAKGAPGQVCGQGESDSLVLQV